MNNVYTNEEILTLSVDQADYDAVSLHRKSTFINLYDSDGEFVCSTNTLDMKQGQDFLFLAEVLRAAELKGLIPLNSLATHKGLVFRLSAVQTSQLQSNLKINQAKKEDWKKQGAPTAPVQQPTSILNANQNVF